MMDDIQHLAGQVALAPSQHGIVRNYKPVRYDICLLYTSPEKRREAYDLAKLAKKWAASVEGKVKADLKAEVDKMCIRDSLEPELIDVLKLLGWHEL